MSSQPWPVLDFTVTGPYEAAVEQLYRLGTVFDLTEIQLGPGPAGAIRITATSPTPALVPVSSAPTT